MQLHTLCIETPFSVKNSGFFCWEGGLSLPRKCPYFLKHPLAPKPANKTTRVHLAAKIQATLMLWLGLRSLPRVRDVTYPALLKRVRVRHLELGLG